MGLSVEGILHQLILLLQHVIWQGLCCLCNNTAALATAVQYYVTSNQQAQRSKLSALADIFPMQGIT